MDHKEAIELINRVAIEPILKILLKEEFRPILQADYLKAYTYLLIFNIIERFKNAQKMRKRQNTCLNIIPKLCQIML
jgi:hypothetical protein